MRGAYDIDFQWAGLATVQTLCTIATPASICVEILGSDVSDASNTTSQQLECYWQRTTNALAGTGTSTLTVSKNEIGDQAAASTVIIGSSASQTEPTYTANTKFGNKGWNSLAGWQYAPLQEERPIVPPSAFLGLKMNVAPTSTAFDVWGRFREIG